MTPKNAERVEITIRLPGMMGSMGAVPAHDLTVVLPGYFAGVSPVQFVRILEAAFRGSNDKRDDPFGDAVRACIELPGNRSSGWYPLAATIDREATIAEAVRRLHRHCTTAYDTSAMAALRRFLHPAAVPVRVEA